MNNCPVCLKTRDRINTAMDSLMVALRESLDASNDVHNGVTVSALGANIASADMSAARDASKPLDPSLPQVVIERYSSNDERVLGRVFWERKQQLFSYELPDKGNARNVSCVPAGRYICTRHITARYPEARRAYVLADVPGRSGILFHSGNTAKDTDGCILLGSSVGKLTVDGKPVDAVLASQSAMEQFHRFINNRRFELEIKNV